MRQPASKQAVAHIAHRNNDDARAAVIPIQLVICHVKGQVARRRGVSGSGERHAADGDKMSVRQRNGAPVLLRDAGVRPRVSPEKYSKNNFVVKIVQ